jgi:hypothetical protein
MAAATASFKQTAMDGEPERPEGRDAVMPSAFEPTTGPNIQGSDLRGGRGDSPSSTDRLPALNQDEKAGSPDGSETSVKGEKPAGNTSPIVAARAADGKVGPSTYVA